MEQFEQIEQRPKSHFGKGVFCGALIMLAIFVVGIGIMSRFVRIEMGPSRPIVSEDEAEGSIITDATIEKLELIQMLLEQNFFYMDDANMQVLQDSIIKGYVAGYQDLYTVYYDEKETTELFESTSGTFSGIGVVVQMDETTGLLKFVTVYEEGPGAAAGFKSGDLVYKVDGEEMAGLDMDTIVSKIRGEIGTQVEITVLRGKDMKEYMATATRAIVETHTVAHEMK